MCIICRKIYLNKKQALLHTTKCHFDLFTKSDQSTSGIIESCDILSIPEDELPSLIAGHGEANLIALQ